MALLLRNARPYLFRGSRPTGVIAGRTFSSGDKKLSLRSPAGLASRNGEASWDGRFGERVTAFSSSASTATTPYRGDTDSADSALHEVTEGGFDYEHGFATQWGGLWMAQDISVTFLGTSSGGGPTKSRNCSSLVVDMLGDGTLWSAFRPLYLT